MMQSFRELDEGLPSFWELNSAEGRAPRVPSLALINCQGAVLSASDQDHLETTFRRGGWQLYRLGLDDDWEHKLNAFTPDVLLVRSGAAGTASVTRIIRLVKGRGQGVCVVVQYGDVAPGLRIAALKAGADVCFSMADTGRSWLAAELLAVVDAARRSRGQGLSRGWSLSDTRRTLYGPEGVTLPLTPIEARFLARLFSSPGCCVRRGANAQGMQSRHMDVLVSRLRSKARRAGVDLPLHAVHHWGYIFLAELSECP